MSSTLKQLQCKHSLICWQALACNHCHTWHLCVPVCLEVCQFACPLPLQFPACAVSTFAHLKEVALKYNIATISLTHLLVLISWHLQWQYNATLQQACLIISMSQHKWSNIWQSMSGEQNSLGLASDSHLASLHHLLHGLLQFVDPNLARLQPLDHTQTNLEAFLLGLAHGFAAGKLSVWSPQLLDGHETLLVPHQPVALAFWRTFCGFLKGLFLGGLALENSCFFQWMALARSCQQPPPLSVSTRSSTSASARYWMKLSMTSSWSLCPCACTKFHNSAIQMASWPIHRRASSSKGRWQHSSSLKCLLLSLVLLKTCLFVKLWHVLFNDILTLSNDIATMLVLDLLFCQPNWPWFFPLVLPVLGLGHPPPAPWSWGSMHHVPSPCCLPWLGSLVLPDPFSSRTSTGTACCPFLCPLNTSLHWACRTPQIRAIHWIVRKHALQRMICYRSSQTAESKLAHMFLLIFWPLLFCTHTAYVLHKRFVWRQERLNSVLLRSH